MLNAVGEATVSQPEPLLAVLPDRRYEGKHRDSNNMYTLDLGGKFFNEAEACCSADQRVHGKPEHHHGYPDGEDGDGRERHKYEGFEGDQQRHAPTLTSTGDCVDGIGDIPTDSAHGLHEVPELLPEISGITDPLRPGNRHARDMPRYCFAAKTWSLVVAALLMAAALRAVPARAQTQDRVMFALGDSYSSGEGAKSFQPGTNVAGVNECRRADSAYPVLVSARAKLQLRFVACSGATTKHVITAGQHLFSPPELFGGARQIDAISAAAARDVITIGIGGNDAGFGKVVQTCLRSDCSAQQARWLEGLVDVQVRLTETYRRVRQQTAATVFAITYPNPLGPKNCVIGFNRSEWEFLRVQFIPKLNTAVRQAARDAGVNLIDLERSYEGFRVCEVSFKSAALNVIAVSKTPGGTKVGDYLHNSFHPNARGHKLAASVVFEAVSRTSGNPPPAIADPPPTIPGSVPVVTLPTIAGPEVFNCDRIPDFVLTDTTRSANYVITDAGTFAFACIIRSTGERKETRSTDLGQLAIQIAPGELVAVRYWDNTDRWNQLTIQG